MGDGRTKLSIALGIIATIVIGIGSGNDGAYAAKLTASSYGDGYSSGVKDASRDLQGLNGHGYDSSCPSGHTSAFCDGYFRGYDVTWNGGNSRGTGNGNGEFDSGYRAGVAKASKDVGKFNANQLNGVDANNPPPCPLPGNKPYCDGWKKGYSDKAVDDLE